MNLNKEEFVLSEQVRLAYGNATSSAIGIYIIAIAIFYGLNSEFPFYLLLAWTGTMLLISSARLFSIWRFHSTYIPSQAHLWGKRLTINTAIAGVGWGSLSLFPILTTETTYKTAIVLILLGVISSSVPLFASYISAFVASSSLSVLILPIIVYTQFEEAAQLLTIALALFIVLVYHITIKTNKNHTKAFELEYEKDKLVNDLSSEVEKRKEIQQQLEYSQQHLERIVEERTLQLKQSNEELTNEVEERKNAQKALYENEQRLQIAGKASYDLIYEWDVSLKKLEWFGDIDRILGYKAGTLSKDQNLWAQSIHPNDNPVFIATVEHYQNGTSQIHNQFRVRHKDGSYRYWSNNGIPLLDDDGRPYKWVCVCTDITEQKEHQKQLEHIAHHDILTNLPNRVLLADRLQQAMIQTQRLKNKLAVIYLDLDGFKNVNDSYGHDTGDRLLVTLSKRLKKILREGDTIARLGGDEFVFILNDVKDSSDHLSHIHRILQITAQPIYAGELSLQVSGSLGVTFYPQTEDTNADQLLRQADQAMYQAKLEGKNRYYIFDSAMDRTLRGRHESLERIYQALDQQEFILHYQPKVNMHTGEIIGVEALIRWQHPDRGLIYPNDFLPAIEDQPFSVVLDEWVINTALSQISIWQSLGLNISVSVNIGAYHLQQPDFVEHLSQLLEKHPDVPNDRLELEILETSALVDVFQVSKVMHECKSIGVSFALDDFGTGYSSLTYLKHLPATFLKIDRTFVRDMLYDSDDLAILEGVLSMSAAFRRNVIAEGVETVQHGQLLLKLGCALAQGYGIGLPMPASEIPIWISEWRPHKSWTQQKRISHEHQSLIYAEIEHRAWVRNINDYLENKKDCPPALAVDNCRFAQWQNNEGKFFYSDNDAFTCIKELHNKVHSLGSDICGQHKSGKHEEVTKNMAELYLLQDALIANLDKLM